MERTSVKPDAVTFFFRHYMMCCHFPADTVCTTLHMGEHMIAYDIVQLSFLCQSPYDPCILSVQQLKTKNWILKLNLISNSDTLFCTTVIINSSYLIYINMHFYRTQSYI